MKVLHYALIQLYIHDERFVMKISKQTFDVLKNFSEINENLLIKPGNKLQTISVMKMF